jgi:hypothetical protein
MMGFLNLTIESFGLHQMEKKPFEESTSILGKTGWEPEKAGKGHQTPPEQVIISAKRVHYDQSFCAWCDMHPRSCLLKLNGWRGCTTSAGPLREATSKEERDTGFPF